MCVCEGGVIQRREHTTVQDSNREPKNVRETMRIKETESERREGGWGRNIFSSLLQWHNFKKPNRKV